jgi:hypothetical protein
MDEELRQVALEAKASVVSQVKQEKVLIQTHGRKGNSAKVDLEPIELDSDEDDGVYDHNRHNRESNSC